MVTIVDCDALFDCINKIEFLDNGWKVARDIVLTYVFFFVCSPHYVCFMYLHVYQKDCVQCGEKYMH